MTPNKLLKTQDLSQKKSWLTSWFTTHFGCILVSKPCIDRSTFNEFSGRLTVVSLTSMTVNKWWLQITVLPCEIVGDKEALIPLWVLVDVSEEKEGDGKDYVDFEDYEEDARVWRAARSKTRDRQQRKPLYHTFFSVAHNRFDDSDYPWYYDWLSLTTDSQYFYSIRYATVWMVTASSADQGDPLI